MALYHALGQKQFAVISVGSFRHLCSEIAAFVRVIISSFGGFLSKWSVNDLRKGAIVCKICIIVGNDLNYCVLVKRVGECARMLRHLPVYFDCCFTA